MYPPICYIWYAYKFHFQPLMCPEKVHSYLNKPNSLILDTQICLVTIAGTQGCFDTFGKVTNLFVNPLLYFSKSQNIQSTFRKNFVSVTFINFKYFRKNISGNSEKIKKVLLNFLFSKNAKENRISRKFPALRASSNILEYWFPSGHSIYGNIRSIYGIWYLYVGKYC